MALYSVGFAASAILTIFAVHALVGSRIAGTAAAPRALAVLAGAALLVGLDQRRARAGRYCSLGPQRQTPKRLGDSWVGVVVWGLDTGTSLTTVRASVLPFAGVLAVALGFGAPWVGAAYAAGFLVPLWALCLVRRPGGRPAESEPLWVSEVLFGLAPFARRAGLVAASLGGLAVALPAALP